jgi:hypothetical protein
MTKTNEFKVGDWVRVIWLPGFEEPLQITDITSNALWPYNCPINGPGSALGSFKPDELVPYVPNVGEWFEWGVDDGTNIWYLAQRREFTADDGETSGAIGTKYHESKPGPTGILKGKLFLDKNLFFRPAQPPVEKAPAVEPETKPEPSPAQHYVFAYDMATGWKDALQTLERHEYSDFVKKIGKALLVQAGCYKPHTFFFHWSFRDPWSHVQLIVREDKDTNGTWFDGDHCNAPMLYSGAAFKTRDDSWDPFVGLYFATQRAVEYYLEEKKNGEK